MGGRCWIWRAEQAACTGRGVGGGKQLPCKQVTQGGRRSRDAEGRGIARSWCGQPQGHRSLLTTMFPGEPRCSAVNKAQVSPQDSDGLVAGGPGARAGALPGHAG